MSPTRLQKLQIDGARRRGYDSPKIFRLDTLLRIEALTDQVWDDVKFIEELKRKLRKAEIS